MLQLNSNGAVRLGAKVMVLGALPMTAGSRAHAHEWEPIETSFSNWDAPFRSGVSVLPNFGLVMPDARSAANVTRPGPPRGHHLGLASHALVLAERRAQSDRSWEGSIIRSATEALRSQSLDRMAGVTK
jgi:hypothetical protein